MLLQCCLLSQYSLPWPSASTQTTSTQILLRAFRNKTINRGTIKSCQQAQNMILKCTFQCLDGIYILMTNTFLSNCILCYNTKCGKKVMRMATLWMNWHRCCHTLHMAVRLAPVVDSIQVWTCYNCYVIAESIWSEDVFVRCVTKMDQQNFEQRCVIKFCVKLDESATVAYEKLRAYGEHSLSKVAQVLFRRPRTSGRWISCRKTFNLRNGGQCGNSEVSCEVRSSIDDENDQ
jgi:hypothetical protein